MNANYDPTAETVSFDNAGTVNKQMLRIQFGLILFIGLINVFFANHSGSILSILWIVLSGFCGIMLFWSFLSPQDHTLSFYLKDIDKIYTTSFLGFKTFKIATKDGEEKSIYTVWPGHSSDQLAAYLAGLNIRTEFN
ncbi:hypothetical protein [Echinicola rosea]|uniref:Uncharacterized protein n=1 Tax=Echinicola rosea TaxID=1807691 RepID=A0ABQ1UX00_9BACT|nr:hypothetical protein [Echinicola rosea]GGF28251.1 hypothetical protein GCM10011339_15560 [Echinicola rosea]